MKLIALLVVIVLAQSLHLPRSHAGEMTLSPVTPLAKVLKTVTPDSLNGQALKISGAKGEIASGQAVLLSNAPISEASASLSDLMRKDSGAKISSSAATLQWVRYISITKNSKGIPTDELEPLAPVDVPDPFWEGAVPVSAGQAQPVWVEINIPTDAEAGDYEGTLKVSDGTNSVDLPVSLHVWNFEIPKERHLSVMNWWNFPGVGFEGVTAYSDKYWELLAKFSAFVVEHRQTEVTAQIMMVDESGDEQQGYKHDTSKLERYAEVVFGAGISRIHLHALGDRTKPHLDRTSKIIPVETAFRRLAAVQQLVKKRGWEKRMVVCICDEPFAHHEESYKPILKRCHETAPDIPVIEAVETYNLDNIDIYVPKLNHLHLWYPEFEKKRQKGSELWFYVCCQPLGRYPNRFLDLPLVKARLLFWISYLYDLDGYLHWGLNYYTGPDAYTEEALSQGLPLGDCNVAYPGKDGLLGSLRYSAQRDGLEDFEYLWLLESRLRDLKEKNSAEADWLDPRQRSLELCKRVAWGFHDYTRDPKVLLDTRSAIAQEIENLNADPMLYVQTSPEEGTVVPAAGPRNIIVRGLATPGSTIMANGTPIEISPGGYFVLYHFLTDDQPVITIEAERNGKKQTAERKFNVTD